MDGQDNQELILSLTETLINSGMFESEEGVEIRQNVLKKLTELFQLWVQYTGQTKNLTEPHLSRVDGQLHTFGSFELGITAIGADLDVLCVAPRHAERSEFYSSFVDRLKAEPGVTDVMAVEDAYVPVVKLVFDNIKIDVVFARLDLPEVCDDVDICDESLWKNVDIQCVRSLAGYCLARTILQAVDNKEAFRTALQAIKLWAKRKGLYSNALGFLGGVTWTMMLTHVCQLYPEATAVTLLHQFFLVFSQWKWPNPVLLKPLPDNNLLGFPVWDPRENPNDRLHLMPVIKPVYPQQNSSYNVTLSSRAVIMEELHNALAVTEKILCGEDGWESLFVGSNFFHKYRHYLVVTAVCTCHEHHIECHYLVVTAVCTCHEHHIEWTGLVEAKIRFLVSNLERNQFVRLAHVFTQSFPSSESFKTHWFIGLTFVKQQGLDINFASDIQNFLDLVYRQATTAGLLRDGMTVNIQHVRRKQLSEFVPETVFDAGGKKGS